MTVPSRTTSSRVQVRYVSGAAVVWAGIWGATALVLKDRGGFGDMIPILAIGTGWFIAVVPAQLAVLDRTGSSREETERPQV